jgi:hypothetical protein
VVPSGITFLSITANPVQVFTAILRASDGAPITMRGGSVQWTVAQSGAFITLDAAVGSQVTATATNAGGTATLSASVIEDGTTTTDSVSVIVSS